VEARGCAGERAVVWAKDQSLGRGLSARGRRQGRLLGGIRSETQRNSHAVGCSFSSPATACSSTVTAPELGGEQHSCFPAGEDDGSSFVPMETSPSSSQRLSPPQRRV